MLRDDVTQIISDLAADLKAASIAIIADVSLASVRASESDTQLTRPLGRGRWLQISWADDDTSAEQTDRADPSGIAVISEASEALERGIRTLRSAARRSAEANLPLIRWPPLERVTPQERVIERISRYLCALANSSQAEIALLMHHRELICQSSEPTELQIERLPFLLKQVAQDVAMRSGSSFGDVLGDDFYARSFWLNSTIILFFTSSFAPDFVRHRVKLVCRELSHLLPLLDDPPTAPASVAPVPE